MNTTRKPRVARTFLNGWKCSGHGVTGYGMSVANAYASWEQRFMRQGVPDYQARNDAAVRALEAEIHAGVARPFDPTPL